VDLKRQNYRLKVGTDKPKLKVKMQSVSDDYVRRRLLEKHCVRGIRKGNINKSVELTSVQETAY